MFYLVQEVNGIADFEAWGAGLSWHQELMRHPRAVEFVDAWLESWADERNLVREVDVNDWLFSDMPYVLDDEGLYDVDEDVWKEDE